MRWPAWIAGYGTSFSSVGLAFAAIFFAASLTPSLLPRTFGTQGVLSGIALAVGYGVGVLALLLWLYLELPAPSARFGRRAGWLTAAVVALVVAVCLWRATVWQNSIRELMEMTPLATAYPWRVAAIAVVTGALVLAVARILGRGVSLAARGLRRVLPPRVALVLGVAVVGILTVFVVNGVLARRALEAADATFSQLDAFIDEGMEASTHPLASGGPESLISWDSIGRQGKRFLLSGPTREELGEFRGGEAQHPLRVYVGLRSGETPRQRAELALAELRRVGGFERSVLVVATPTGSGWLDNGAVDTLEYLHGGDTAIVATQYSYLPRAFDIPMATTVPTGYGHNYAPAHYIDAWVAVTDPPGWGAEDTARLKERFADVHPRP